MKVKKNGKVVIINDSLLQRYLSMGYEMVSDENKAEEKKAKKNVNVSTHDNAN